MADQSSDQHTRRDLLGAGVCMLAGAAAGKVAAEPAKVSKAAGIREVGADMRFYMPTLRTNHTNLDKAFRIAMGDLMTNIQSYKGGIVDDEQPAILAGLNYDRPWTRDASINVWNWGGAIVPEVARDTLRCVLKEHEGKTIVGGQYWDAVIWVTGAWNYYLFTGDREFLKSVFGVAVDTLAYFEKTELDRKSNLFWGPACYGDGVAAYPEYYAKECQGASGIDYWGQYHKSDKAGVGIPMKALSTNCLYYHAYVITRKMAKELSRPTGPWNEKAATLKDAINEYFWDEGKGRYVYLADYVVALNESSDVERDGVFADGSERAGRDKAGCRWRSIQAGCAENGFEHFGKKYSVSGDDSGYRHRGKRQSDSKHSS